MKKQLITLALLGTLYTYVVHSENVDVRFLDRRNGPSLKMQHKIVDLNLASPVTVADLKAIFDDAHPEFIEVYDKNNHLILNDNQEINDEIALVIPDRNGKSFIRNNHENANSEWYFRGHVKLLRDDLKKPTQEKPVQKSS